MKQILCFVVIFHVILLSCGNVAAQIKSLEVVYELEEKPFWSGGAEAKEREEAISLANMKNQNKALYALAFGNGHYRFQTMKSSAAIMRLDDGTTITESAVLVDEYIDFNTSVRYSLSEVIDKAFIVKTSLEDFNWELTEEEAMIEGKLCHKAYFKKNERETVTAWFTTAIPAPVGPAGYYGLSGLILRLEAREGVYTAVNIEYTNKEVDMTLPKDIEQVSEEEFRALEEKMFKEWGMK